MMKVNITVRPRKKPHIPVEAENLVPETFLRDYSSCTVWRGNREIPFSEVFDIEVQGSAESADDVEIILSGDSSIFKRVGEYMTGGKITVEGDIGMHCGNFMSGGQIEIMGNADGWLGREMKGGSILCHGNAGVYCGSGYRGEKTGMRGGRIEVLGNAGDFCAECLAGGEIVIRGSSGDMTGVEMSDGKLTIHGNCSRACGNMTGGVATVFGNVSGMIPTFRDDGEITLDGQTLTLFTGDVANRGKGSLRVASYTLL